MTQDAAYGLWILAAINVAVFSSFAYTFTRPRLAREWRSFGAFPPREKVWRTLGEPRLWIIASYEMRLAIEPLSAASSRLTISIVYDLPRPAFWRSVGLLLARSYSRWCLRQMLQDARRALEAPVRMTA
jgi:hypothetical protein